MTKTVILELEGDFASGFRVTSEIDGTNSFRIKATLPPDSQLAERIEEHWQEKYRNLEISYRIKLKRVRHIQPFEKQVENCRVSANQLCDRFHRWLGEKSFQELEKQLRSRLNLDEEVRFIIRTENRLLQKLPWQEWQLFQDLVRGEVALSPLESRSTPQRVSLPRPARVRILAIFGFDEAIDLEEDRQQIEALPNTKAMCLTHPSRQEVLDRLREESWDIIIFAGHGQTEDGRGSIQINPHEKLLLDDLWFSLRKAVERGLQLAIFNSCDGLGLSRCLDDLHIPQMIVMRELVPDRVAQRFLTHFLKIFAGGQSLYESVRQTRQLLKEELEIDFPCASWLPAICQHPAFVPPKWDDLYYQPQPVKNLPSKEKIFRGFRTSILATIAVVLARSLGILYPLESTVYDRFLQMRPDEGPDPRISIIEVAEIDLKLPEQENRKGSLSDTALDRLLQELELARPRTIGLNIIRDFPVSPEFKQLKTRLQTLNNFFAVCHVGIQGEGILPPPEVDENRLGFTNVLPDSDGIIRRQLLFMDEFAKSSCPSRHAFSLRLALHYLGKEGIVPEFSGGNLKLGNVIFQRLKSPVGMYQKADTWGNQILLNYRSYRSPLEIAEIVTLEDVLQGKLRRSVLRDRIILIGTNHNTSPQFNTPYPQEMPNTTLQAQMTSQILSAVLDGRPLLRFVPWWIELFSLLAWSSLVAILMEFLPSRIHRFLAVSLAIAAIGSTSYWLLLTGYWLSAIVPILAIIFVFLASIITKEKQNSLN